MKTSLLQLSMILLVGIIVVSCGNNAPKEQVVEEKPNPIIKGPDFNSDTAYSYVEKQVSFGPRVPNTKAHLKCAEYLVKKFKTFTQDVIVQQTKVRAYDGTVLDCKNIIASFNPEKSDRILILTHWDSRHIADHDPDPSKRKEPVLAANDAGSGVAILMEIARQLKIKNPGIGVDLFLTDAEDYGQPEDALNKKEDTWCLGSQYWANNPHKPGYKARFGILLDMVGAKDATFLKEEFSMQYAPDVVNMVWETASNLGYSKFFVNLNGGAVDDDHLYVNKIIKIPTIDIITQDPTGQYSFFPYWHTTHDDMSHIDRKTLEAVGKTILQLIYQTTPLS